MGQLCRCRPLRGGQRDLASQIVDMHACPTDVSQARVCSAIGRAHMCSEALSHLTIVHGVLCMEYGAVP
jgi:hypothetical protein